MNSENILKKTSSPFIKVTHLHSSETGRDDEYFTHQFHVLTSSNIEHSNEIGNNTAALILTAVNNHQEMLEALKVIDTFVSSQSGQRIPKPLRKLILAETKSVIAKVSGSGKVSS